MYIKIYESILKWSRFVFNVSFNDISVICDVGTLVV